MSANWFDRAIATVAPQAVARRVQAARMVEATSRYAGAAGGRRASSWTGRNGSANMAVGTHLATLRNRSRELVRDHWAFARILDVLVSHAVGHGIQVRADNGSDRVDRRAEAAFADWAEEADVTGEQNLHGLIALSFRAMLEGGESLVRFVDLPASDPRRVKLGLQVWEGDIIDAARDGPTEGRQVRLGVALGRHGQREGYYLFPEHPGEHLATGSGGTIASRFTPRSDVIHLYRDLRPGQVRGVPAFAPVLLQARDLDDLMEATIVIRVLPIHDALGWLVARRPTTESDLANPIRPVLKPGGPDGKRSWYMTKAFGTFRRSRGITDKGKVFHSIPSGRTPSSAWNAPGYPRTRQRRSSVMRRRASPTGSITPMA